MTESSKFWTTSNIGDGPSAGYSRSDIAAWVLAIFGRSQGVLRTVMNELAVTGSSSPLAVNTGRAIVDGLLYENSASLGLTVASPSIGTTGGRVVLEASWSAQTVRAKVVKNTDGNAAIPALTQTGGTTYQVSLATFTITTGGAITLTDDRSYAVFADSPRIDALGGLAALSVIGRASDTAGASDAIAAGSDGLVMRRNGTAIAFGQLAAGGLLDNAVGNGNIRQSAGLSLIGRAANSTGDAADITAATDGLALRRNGTALDFGQIVEGALDAGAASLSRIGSDAVDDAKLGDRVLAVNRRQGGSASGWHTPGASSYTPGAVMMLCGAQQVTIPDGSTWETGNISYPAAFSAGAVVTLNVESGTSEFVEVQAKPIGGAEYSGVAFAVNRSGSTGALTVTLHWLAVGPA